MIRNPKNTQLPKVFLDAFQNDPDDLVRSIVTILTGREVTLKTRKGLMNSLEKVLSENTETALRHLPEFELRLLRDLSMQGRGGKLFIHEDRVVRLSTLMHFVEVEKLPRARFAVSFTPYSYDIIAPHAGAAYAKSELTGELFFEHFLFGCLSLYGMLTVAEIEELMEDYFSEDKDLLAGMRLFLEDSTTLRILLSDEDNVCFPAVTPEDAKILNDIFKKDSSPRNRFTLEQVIEAGKSMPECVPLKNSPEGKNLFDTLVEMDFDNDMILWIMTDFWETMQLEGASAVEEAIVDYVYPEDSNEESDPIILQKQESVLKKAVVGYLSVVPLWTLHGHSLSETGRSFYSYSPFSHSEDRPAIRAFRKVGQNDPCPCGSGLKYKYCHGKNLN